MIESKMNNTNKYNENQNCRFQNDGVQYDGEQNELQNMYKENVNCSFCGITEKSQNHILDESTKLHMDEHTKITKT